MKLTQMKLTIIRVNKGSVNFNMTCIHKSALNLPLKNGEIVKIKMWTDFSILRLLKQI